MNTLFAKGHLNSEGDLVVDYTQPTHGDSIVSGEVYPTPQGHNRLGCISCGLRFDENEAIFQDGGGWRHGLCFISTELISENY